MCANYDLQRTAKDNQTEFPEASESVHNNFHMDEFLESSQTVEQVTRKTQDLVMLQTLGELSLTKFVANVPSSSSQYQHDCESPKNDIEILPTVTGCSHVLCLRWNHRVDTPVVSRVTSPDLNTAITQRVVLSVVSSVYDPFCAVAPYTMKALLLLKNIKRLVWPLASEKRRLQP